jgi:hypothetical protein
MRFDQQKREGDTRSECRWCSGGGEGGNGVFIGLQWPWGLGRLVRAHACCGGYVGYTGMVLLDVGVELSWNTAKGGGGRGCLIREQNRARLAKNAEPRSVEAISYGHTPHISMKHVHSVPVNGRR